MAFIICDDQKQNINLSDYAWNCIYEDMVNFFEGDIIKTNLSGFLNIIFQNYYQFSNASISFRINEYEDELNTIFQNEEFSNIPSNIIKKINKTLISSFSAKLKKIENKYPKGEYRKFRLNNANYSYLTEESTEDKYYNSSSGHYLKALFEEYTRLTYSEREHIFFRHTFETIIDSINNNCLLKITIKNGKKFQVIPYSIENDKVGIFNYLVGYNLDSNPCSFRISRITNITMLRSKKVKLDNKQKQNIDHILHTQGPQFLAGQNIPIVIKFTDTGLNKYKTQIHLRPNVSEKIDKNTFVFNCSEVQTIYYFFKFGREITIISPKSLRDKFARFYNAALRNYKNEQKEVS